MKGGKEQLPTCNDRWRERNREKARCYTVVWEAVRCGKIQKQPCEKCGSRSRIHAHHEDYSKPFEIKWLCSFCHRQLHAERQGQSLWPKGTTNYYQKVKQRKAYKKRAEPAHPSPKKDELLDKAIQMRADGVGYHVIARTLGVSSGTVYKWLNNTPYN